jgi:hypothetical protein
MPRPFRMRRECIAVALNGAVILHRRQGPSVTIVCLFNMSDGQVNAVLAPEMHDGA